MSAEIIERVLPTAVVNQDAAIPAACVPKRILFVDDELNVLNGLRRMLRTMRHVWEMDFVEGGSQALARLAEKPYDVVVTDMRMPGMDGAQLLAEVARRYPSTVRIVLSGHSDQAMMFAAMEFTHQFLRKPCNPNTLLAAVSRAFALRERLGCPAIRQLIAGAQTLPSVPEVYRAVVAEVQSSTCSVARVGEIISRDVALSAKVLQLANSPFFGLLRPVYSSEEAAALLGLDVLKSLALSAAITSQFVGAGIADSALEDLTRHSLVVATSAKAIARHENCEKQQIDEAFMAGMLHDVGELILMANLPEQFASTRQQNADCPITAAAAERKLLGTTHAELGAFLLGLWGLPQSIIEIIAFHHQPSEFAAHEFTALLAVHVADALTYEIEHDRAVGNARLGIAAPKPDVDYIESLGMSNRLVSWRALCRSSIDSRAKS